MGLLYGGLWFDSGYSVDNGTTPCHLLIGGDVRWGCSACTALLLVSHLVLLLLHKKEGSEVKS